MVSSSFPSLKALVVFRNGIHQEKFPPPSPVLFRSVHVYEFEGGVEEIVEREYAFHLVGAYEERKSPGKVFTRQNFNVSAHHAELTNGVWVCILAFDKDHISQFDLRSIPEILCVVRNPKLASIPTLARDLDVICQLKCKSENRESSEKGELSENQTQETMEGPSERPQSVDFDLNSVPLSDSDDEGNEVGDTQS